MPVSPLSDSTRRILTGPVILVAVLLATNSLSAAIFQYAAAVPSRKGECMAYLWVPPEAAGIRGVVMGGMTLMERELAQDAHIRVACAEEQLAIVFVNRGLSSIVVVDVLDALAAQSGYQELSVTPLLFVGHSAGGPQARRCAREMHDRCFGLVQYRGADPGDTDHQGAESVGAGIPALMMIGQFDEFGKIGRDANGIENWEKDRDKLVAFRRQRPDNLGSVVVEPGAGHFAWSERSAKYVALFLRKAAQARIPAGFAENASAPLPLKTIDPASGWLSDPTIKSPSRYPPAPYSKYQGDPAEAVWHLDESLAVASSAYHAGIAKADQFIQWKDPHSVNAGARNFFTDVEWVADGQTFEVHPAYAESYPASGSPGAKWGRGGEPVGHAASPILVRHVSGPIVAAGRHRFRVQYDELAPATETARCTFLAYSHGDEQFRYTERVGMIASERFVLNAGRPQTITFPEIDDVPANAKPVALHATSDSGLDVEYHVAFGPARVVDGKLVLAELPRRAKFPLNVTVVAYQFGRGIEPRTATAKPVAQTLQVLPASP